MWQTDGVVRARASGVCTPLCMSPELCMSRPYDHKSDVWALGCVLYELTSLRRPFSAQGFAQLIVSVLLCTLRGRCEPIPLQVMPPFKFGTAAPVRESAAAALPVPSATVARA